MTGRTMARARKGFPTVRAGTSKMASSTKIKVVERISVSPSPGTVPTTSLPLTILDIPWLLFFPNQTLFFYHFPTSTPNFTQTIIPNLKHSLSLTLQHFYPLAGKLVTPPQSAIPYLECTDGDDSISLTIAEAVVGEFNNLSGNHPRKAQDFHSLVPVLPPSKISSKKSLLAIQITIFPQFGICIGFTLRHVVADWRTFNNFLKTWASVFSKKNGTFDIDRRLVASHDRSVIRDTNGLESILFKEWGSIKIPEKETGHDKVSRFYDMVRATFVLGPKEMEKIKKWILNGSELLFGSTQLLLSPYVITCAFIWVCWMNTHWSILDQNYNGDSIHYFGFIAGGITRLHYPVPGNYAGNCVGFGRSAARRDELMGENGIIYAAKAIGDTIKRLNGNILGGAKNWISEWNVLRDSELHVMVTGSPKLDIYSLDFGWGGPKKIEEISIDYTRSISLCETRVVVGGIEIGLVLPNSSMNDFSTHFNKCLVNERSIAGCI